MHIQQIQHFSHKYWQVHDKKKPSYISIIKDENSNKNIVNFITLLSVIVVYYAVHDLVIFLSFNLSNTEHFKSLKSA